MKLVNPKKNRGEKPVVRYAHIGYPKCASTALQHGYLGRHSHLLHLGCGPNKNPNFWDDHGYIDEHINQALEVDLRYKNKFAYDAEETKAAFERHFEAAEANPEVHAVGVSNENLCFNWHGGIETTEKAQRLFEIFEAGTQIIIVLRDQKSMIESLYKESVRCGYSGSFQDYLKYIWQYRDRNFFYDFAFNNVIKVYSDLFGRENLHILFFEDLKENSAAFLESICQILKVDYHALDFGADFNQQLSADELAVKKYINERYPHTLEKGIYHPMDTHRFVPYLESSSGGVLDFEHHFDYHIRHGLCRSAQKIASVSKLPRIDMSWSGESARVILEYYQKENEKLIDYVKRSDLEKYNYLSLQPIG